jgi:hypothetical protein
MSVDTDKGIDDLPPDADTLRDPTHTPFSLRKILSSIFKNPSIFNFRDRSSAILFYKLIILY